LQLRGSSHPTKCIVDGDDTIDQKVHPLFFPVSDIFQWCICHVREKGEGTLKLNADDGEGNLFTQERKVLLLFFANKSQINKSDIISVQRSGKVTKEYSFDGRDEIEVQLLDAVTKQQLDRAVVKQNKDRDLGGLL